jgi:hypothetical protein
MSNEGYILSIEGCPYAFSTNGIPAGLLVQGFPTHPDWADSWTVIDNCLVNPNDYVSWNERTLPIEGDLEVDGITLKLLDKYVENFALYDGTSFSGNLLTELFTRGSARESPLYLERSLPSIVSQAPAADEAYNNELLLFSDPGLPDPAFANNAYYNPRRVSASYDMSTTFGSGLRPIWIEDECLAIIGTAQAVPGPVDPKVLVVGISTESTLGRGYYGTENKYHRIRETYSPEIFLKHPLVIKRGVILWRVEDAYNVTDESIYPIWRGYCQSSPELTPDGSTFELRAEHKWNTYKNETVEYAGFRHNFSIPQNTYSKNAMFGIHKASNNWNRVIQPANFRGTDPFDPTTYYNWDTDYRYKFATDPAACFRGNAFVSPPSPTRFFRPALINAMELIYGYVPWNYTATNVPGGKVRLGLSSDEDLDPAPATPQYYTIGGRIAGQEFWAGNVERWGGVGIDSPVIPPVCIDFVQNGNPGGFRRPLASPTNPGQPFDYGYSLKFQLDGRSGLSLPTQYLYLPTPSEGPAATSGPQNIVIRHAYVGEAEDTVILLEPSKGQSELTAPNNVIVGRISKVNKESFQPAAADGTTQYITEPLAFKSAVSVQSESTVIETLIKSILRPRSGVTLFNNVNNSDFDLSNLVELIQWVSSLDGGRKIRWIWTEETKFMEFIQPYMRFFNYIIALKGSKIQFKTYDSTGEPDHILTTADFLEAPVNLSTLPENLFNTMKLSAPNYETVFTFNDDLSKGRYKIGNTQEIELPASVGGITSPQDLIVYFQQVATRFLSIWGYPQYVFKCKTSIERINIELGDTVNITDWLVPNFDKDNPQRGLLERNGLVIERRVDLTTGVIDFSIVYGEKFDTSFYSPGARALSATNIVVGKVIFAADYIRPSNKQQILPIQPPPPGVYTTNEEVSSYAGSNRYAYRNRYAVGLGTEDGGVSSFKVGDRVEFIWRNNSSNFIFNGATAGSLTVTNVNPVTREITFNELLDPGLLALINSGLPGPNDYQIDLRYTDYNLCTTTQQQEYGFCGDFIFESLDFPLPTPPARRVVPATQYSV